MCSEKSAMQYACTMQQKGCGGYFFIQAHYFIMYHITYKHVFQRLHIYTSEREKKKDKEPDGFAIFCQHVWQCILAN